MNSITVQRWIGPQQAELFCRFFKPLMDRRGGWTIYEIDDLMFDGTLLDADDARRAELEAKYGDLRNASIPKFNRGRKPFEGEAVQRAIKTMLNAADLVTVTTDHLREVYHDLYGVPTENIVAVPNLLPHALFGDRYDPQRKAEQFRRNFKKPRIGIVSSLSHYNVDGVREDEDGYVCRKNAGPDGETWVNEKGEIVPFEKTREIVDDIDAVLDCIRDTVGEFQWVFFGFCPPQLQDLVKQGKIEYMPGAPIQNYASRFHNLNLQAVVAPINPSEFNFCKSFIKYMECAALGVPCFATNCLPYSRVMPESQLFSDSAQLRQMLRRLKSMPVDAYRGLIERQWKWFHTPRREGDFQLKNFWLEENLNVWVDMCRLRQKTLELSVQGVLKQYRDRKKAEAEKTIFKNDNIQIMK